MEQLPSTWRDELLHPKVVHFPIALLIFGTALFIAALIFRKNEKLSFLMPASRLAIFIGAIGAWTAVLTGNIADSFVARELCDPIVAKDHERFAYLVAYLFSGGILLDFFTRFFKLASLKKFVPVIILLLYLVGTGVLLYVGHLGGKLVFQQGAAVYQPSEDCSEFE